MLRLPDNKINIEKLSVVFLWGIAILYFYFISLHSSMPAESSTKASEALVKKTYSVVKNVTEVVRGETPKVISYTNVLVFVRKSAHMLNFYILGFLCCMTAFKINGRRFLNFFIAAVVCGLSGAIIDECHQRFVPGRSAEIRDVLIDLTGVCGGCITFITGVIVCNIKKYGRDK